MDLLRLEEAKRDAHIALSRSFGRNASHFWASRSSSFFVQSQSQQAHGSVPFKSRQFPRACASVTLSSSKYFSQ